MKRAIFNNPCYFASRIIYPKLCCCDSVYFPDDVDSAEAACTSFNLHKKYSCECYFIGCLVPFVHSHPWIPECPFWLTHSSLGKESVCLKTFLRARFSGWFTGLFQNDAKKNWESPSKIAVDAGEVSGCVKKKAITSERLLKFTLWCKNRLLFCPQCAYPHENYTVDKGNYFFPSAPSVFLCFCGMNSPYLAVELIEERCFESEQNGNHTNWQKILGFRQSKFLFKLPALNAIHGTCCEEYSLPM